MALQNSHNLVASCEFSFTEEDFEEYVKVSDYMAKRRIHRRNIILLLIFIGFYLWLAIFAGLFNDRFLALLLGVLFSLFFFATIFYSIMPIARKPLGWMFRTGRTDLIRMYKDALGYSPDATEMPCMLQIEGNSLLLKTTYDAIDTSMDRILWVKQHGDMVIAGCFSGTKSFQFVLAPHGSPPINKPVPAIAFVASKLKGADPDAFIAHLKECAKKPKPPEIRYQTWK